MSTRQDLATAASGVDGVTCSAYYRQTTKPGDAFVRLDLLARDDTGFGYMATWQVAVLLPQDLAEAEKWVETHVDALLEALSAEGVVTGAQPVQLTLNGPTLPALILTVVREKE